VIEKRFKPGDRVYIKQDVDIWKDRDKKDKYGGNEKPARITIIEVITQECYGGTQIHYHLRMYCEKGPAIWDLLEYEVTDSLE
jgi:hypothetical protein